MSKSYLTESQWQRNRKVARRTQFITGLIIALPLLFLIGSSGYAAYLMYIH